MSNATGSTQATAGASETLHDWLDRHAATAADRPACVGPHGAISYGQLQAQALALAAGLRSLGLGKGDVIAAQLPNTAEFLLTYLAAGAIGAILQTIHMPYRAAEIEPLLRHGRARAFVCLSRAKDFSAAELALSLKSRLDDLAAVIAVGADAPDGAIPFARLATAAGGVSGRPAADDRFLLLYTSGTTAAPKGVPVRYAGFLANARLSAAELGVDGDSVLLSAAPFTHLYGLFSVNLALAAGAATAVLPSFTPGELAAAFDAYRPTALFVAPAHMAACLNEGLLTRERLASLRFMLISGSTCPPRLAEALQEMMPGGKVCQLWGMSELQAGSFTRPTDPALARLNTVGRASPGTALRVVEDGAVLPPDTEGELQVRGVSVFEGYLANADASAAAFSEDGWFRTGDLARLNTVGRASPGTALRVVEDGAVLPPDAEGELQVRGVSVFEGYLANADASAAAFSEDGWFRTGDLARIDADGNLSITGRTKELINRGGVKFNPADVEAVIAQHPAVAACAMVPMPDPVLGERACCFVVVRPGAAVDLDALRVWLTRHEIAKTKWPERVELIDELPMTPTRKVKKAELASRLARG